MAWTTPNSSRATSYVVTAPNWNEAQANLAFLGTPPSVKAVRSAVQSIPTATPTAVSWTGTDAWDKDSMHSSTTNPSRITIVTAGIYVFEFLIEWAGSAAGGRQSSLRKNAVATNLVADDGFGAVAPAFPISQQRAYRTACIVGDFFEVYVNQTAGAPLDVTANSWFEATMFSQP